jgi:hypothetical protein
MEEPVHFEHKYASGCRSRYAKEQGGFLKHVLTVTANIPLDASDPAYDPAKENELTMAAIAYAQSRGSPFDSVEFEQGQTDDDHS